MDRKIKNRLLDRALEQPESEKGFAASPPTKEQYLSQTAFLKPIPENHNPLPTQVRDYAWLKESMKRAFIAGNSRKVGQMSVEQLFEQWWESYLKTC